MWSTLLAFSASASKSPLPADDDDDPAPDAVAADLAGAGLAEGGVAAAAVVAAVVAPAVVAEGCDAVVTGAGDAVEAAVEGGVAAGAAAEDFAGGCGALAVELATCAEEEEEEEEEEADGKGADEDCALDESEVRDGEGGAAMGVDGARGVRCTFSTFMMRCLSTLTSFSFSGVAKRTRTRSFPMVLFLLT